MSAGEIVLLAKADRFSTDSAELARRVFGSRLTLHQGRVGDPFPLRPAMAPIAGLLSFLSPWIVPAWVLEKSEVAVNFHPASREYPGIGCYNFAIYEGAASFGAVCHHMEPAVDTGQLIAETRFAMAPDERVETLKLRTMVALAALFAEIVDLIAAGKPLPKLGKPWSRKPFTRKQLNELCIVEPEMDEGERRRRIRAVSYPGYPGAVERRPDGTLAPLDTPPGEPIA